MKTVKMSDGSPRVVQDGQGRRFHYLRLSLTEVCNFRCAYCLPEGYRKPCGRSNELELAEIGRAVRAFAKLGLWKIRLTGGEPTVRRDFDDIARLVSQIPGVRKVAMTTNGYRLFESAHRWRAAGVQALNVSVDSLNPERFARITGHDRLSEVLGGIEAARCAGFQSIKINTVLMRDINDDELDAVIRFVEDRDIAVRFIEVMRTNENVAFFNKHHIRAEAIVKSLEDMGWTKAERGNDAGPAIEYTHPSSRGRIGVITPYERNFCASCNRLRLASDGKLHLCLFGDGGIDLRPMLQSDADEDRLIGKILDSIKLKAPTHRLHDGNSGVTPHLASIGG